MSNGNDSRRRPLRCEVAERGAQQADAVCSQRSLSKLIDDAQRPAHSAPSHHRHVDRSFPGPITYQNVPEICPVTLKLAIS